MKYRKKPIVIEATQWFKHGDHDAVLYPDGNYMELDNDYIPPDYGKIETLEGAHTVSHGDWIITGINGEHYPCKPDIFEKTYDKVEG